MKTLFGILAALAFVLIAATSQAGIQGRATGKVLDSAGNPVEGVTLTVTTPSNRIIKLTATTKKDGSFGFIVNDATLFYDVKFEKDGYRPINLPKQKLSTVEMTNLPNQTMLKTSEAPAGGAGAIPAQQAPPSASEAAAVAYNAGVDLLNAGDKAGAEAKLKEAVAKNPDLPQAWNALATVAYENKDYTHALEYGQKALDLDPTATGLYGMMTDSAEKSGDKKAAAEWRKKYEEVNADSPDILFNKGVDAYNRGKMKDAEASLQKAVDAKPDFAMAHYLLGMTSFNLNKKAQAREHLQKYLELDPNGKEAATVKEILPLVK
jgi:Tfp pilus assembly protein PilF